MIRVFQAVLYLLYRRQVITEREYEYLNLTLHSSDEPEDFIQGLFFIAGGRHGYESPSNEVPYVGDSML